MTDRDVDIYAIVLISFFETLVGGVLLFVYLNEPDSCDARWPNHSTDGCMMEDEE